MNTGIYCIINKINNKRYIGSTSQSFQQRWNKHKSSLNNNKHHSGRLQNSWNKYGEENFIFIVLETCEPKYCIIREQWWLDLFGTYLDTFGYNICAVANSCLGVKHTLEQRNKLKKQKSEEHKRKLSEINKGKSIPIEVRKKIKKSCAKLSYNVTDPQGNITLVNNLREFCRNYNLDIGCITNLANKTRNITQHKGYKITKNN